MDACMRLDEILHLVDAVVRISLFKADRPTYKLLLLHQIIIV